MILSLLIWYFIPPQLCSPHCTTCVYCLKHTCQIKEQLMHLIFNYCPPCTMGKCQSNQSAVFAAVVGTPPSPSAHACTETPTGIWILSRNWNVSQLECIRLTLPLSVWRYLVRITACAFVFKLIQKSRKLCKIQNLFLLSWESCTDKKKYVHDCADSRKMFFFSSKTRTFFNSYMFNWTVRWTLGGLLRFFSTSLRWSSWNELQIQTQGELRAKTGKTLGRGCLSATLCVCNKSHN